MMVIDVIDCVEDIHRVRHDGDAAHSKEDKLYEDVLRAIADDCLFPQLLAKIALKTKQIKFTRYTS